MPFDNLLPVSRLQYTLNTKIFSLRFLWLITKVELRTITTGLHDPLEDNFDKCELKFQIWRAIKWECIRENFIKQYRNYYEFF